MPAVETRYAHHLMQTRVLHARLLGVRYGDLTTLTREELVSILLDLLSLDPTDAEHIDTADLRALLQRFKDRKKSLKRPRLGGAGESESRAHKRSRRMEIVKEEEEYTELLIEDVYYEILRYMPLRWLLQRRLVSERWRVIIDTRIIPEIERVDDDDQDAFTSVSRSLLSQFRGLRELWLMPLAMNAQILRSMTRLESINVSAQWTNFLYRPTDADLAALPALQRLTLGYRHDITVAGLKALPHLTYLSLGDGDTYANRPFPYLPQLTELALGSAFTNHIGGAHRTVDVLSALPALTTLRLGWSYDFLTADVVQYSNITHLYLETASGIENVDLALLTHLKLLHLGADDDPEIGMSENDIYEHDISDDGIYTLVNLTALYLGTMTEITDRGIASLQALTVLDLGESYKVTSGAIALLPALVDLTLAHPDQYNKADLGRLSHLKRLNLGVGGPTMEIERSRDGRIEWSDAMDVDGSVMT